MKKKILIIMPSMSLGGAETSLLGLLESFDYEQVEVSLFLFQHGGELVSYIPNEVKLLESKSEYEAMLLPIKGALKKKKPFVVLGRTIGKILAKRTEKKILDKQDSIVGIDYSHKYTRWALPLISKEQYDLIISFMTPHYCGIEKVYGRIRIAWIHTDYAKYKIDVTSELKMWEKYDYVVSISEDVTRSFLKVFPSLESKIVEIQNIIPQSYVRKKENEFLVKTEMPDDGTIKLLSIGRFTNAKNFDNIPNICRRIRENGVNVKWYIIGFGSVEGEKLIREKIAEEHMQEHVIILGKKENPYPYIKACDFYVQPSRYEGKSVAVREAQMLGKPVVITNYATAKSQLEDGVDGVIVPMDNEGCAEGICNAIKKEELCNRLIDNTRSRDYTSADEVKKIYSLLRGDKYLKGNKND